MQNINSILTLAIPIVAVVMGIGVAAFNAYLNFRKRREIFQLHHTERMAAIEKGIDLPPLPPEFFRDHHDATPPPARYRRRGLILLFVGIALTVALWRTGEGEFWWGLLPIGLGLAYLLSARLEAGDPRSLPPSDPPTR